MGHAIREMMEVREFEPALSGVVELDEKYLGGKPPLQTEQGRQRGQAQARSRHLCGKFRCARLHMKFCTYGEVSKLADSLDTFFNEEIVVIGNGLFVWC